jgi:hypothetical protein
VLSVGDSLLREIDRGLAQSRSGVVVLSRSFFAKDWPQRELAGLAQKESSDGRTVILPVWHDVDDPYVRSYSPLLADRFALSTAEGIPRVAVGVAQRVRADTPLPTTLPLPAKLKDRAVEISRVGARPRSTELTSLVGAEQTCPRCHNRAFGGESGLYHCENCALNFEVVDAL